MLRLQTATDVQALAAELGIDRGMLASVSIAERVLCVADAGR